jgi:uncharacterized membrane protein YdjX (TVP38/TMEM64 family)
MKFRTITFYLWLIIITAGMLTYLFFPEAYSVSFLTEVVESYHAVSILVYFLLILIQGIVFVPLPLVIVGVVIFNPIEVLIVNMISVVTSATIVYYFSKFLGFDTYFETNYRKDAQKIRNSLKHKELPIIITWSLLPLTPTNLVVYIASTLRINVFKCLLGVFIGEIVVNVFYIITIRMLLKNIIA